MKFQITLTRQFEYWLRKMHSHKFNEFTDNSRPIEQDIISDAASFDLMVYSIILNPHII